jgi:ATP-dependent DNA helicase RecG
MRETEDGFYIAEKDLRLRGSGELLGTKQSGLPNFHVASILDHEELLVLAAQEATRILKEDPTLSTPAYKPLRILLHLFQQEKAVAYLGAG